MHVSPDDNGRHLRLTLPPDHVAEVAEQLRAMVRAIGDPVAAARMRRLKMQLRGQADEATLRASPEDLMLLLEWGLRGAQADLDAVLDADRPAVASAEAAFERVRWYLGALADVQEGELAAAGLTAEDVSVDPSVEPLAVRRGRWHRDAADDDDADVRAPAGAAGL